MGKPRVKGCVLFLNVVEDICLTELSDKDAEGMPARHGIFAGSADNLCWAWVTLHGRPGS